MHEQYILAALDQAWLGRGACAPNPAVGAIAVRHGTIIAQAFHSGAGHAHAEQVLLSRLTGVCADVTLYVTLEPCNHWGRTAPCVDALIERGVQRVVYAYRDPNPVVANNNTPARLQAAGVEVLHYPMAEVAAFYQSYTRWVRTGRPRVTVKMAQSLDGKIAGVNSAPVALSNTTCALFTHQQRLHTDVILTTAKTINQDNPRLDVRLPDQCIKKTVAILDTHNVMRADAALAQTAQQCLVYCATKPANPRDNCEYHEVESTPDGLNLNSVFEHLGHLGYHDVWVEAGATLFNALHRAHLVSRTYLYVVPRVLGPQALSLHDVDAHWFEPNAGIKWRVMDDNGMVCIEFDNQGDNPQGLLGED